MRGMRNRIAHGYFEINLDVVWDTVQTALPELLERLRAVREGEDEKKDEDCKLKQESETEQHKQQHEEHDSTKR